MKTFIFAVVLLGLPAWSAAADFDQAHSGWNVLLKQHVKLLNGGVASQLDYQGMRKDQTLLTTYTKAVSQVARPQFDAWSREQQLAFLINAYNAFTVQLILGRYPDLTSIKDLGSFLRSPWKQKFFTLFGEEATLDHIEQDLIRAPGRYREPRIHFAVVCASIGCPGLREEAYVADKLDTQLENSMRRFLSDRSRNRYNTKSDVLEVSKIFDWYGADFSHGDHGYTSLANALSGFADQLADDPAARARIRKGEVKIKHLDYDWNLNDVKKP